MSTEAAIILEESDAIPPVSRSRKNDRDMLVICIGVAVVACLMQVVDGEYVAFRGFSQYPLPHSCFSRSVLNVDCPGCGLTRSFILLAEGRFTESFARHRVGIPLALALLIQIPYRTLRLLRPDREWVARPYRRAFSTLLIILLLGNWLMNQLLPGW